MIQYILLPGRHHAVTKFQVEYQQNMIRGRKATTIDQKEIEIAHNAQVIWAVTSANHSNTRRNPISGARRLGMIESVVTTEQLPSHVYLIPNMQNKPDFAHYVIEDIYLQSRGRIKLTPENCIVACSTPAVIEQYEKLGYQIAPAELEDRESGKNLALRPWDVVEELIASGAEWRSNGIVRDELHPVCFEQYEHYGLGDLIAETFQDPLTQSGDGDITTTRDYETYRAAFEQNAFRKVDMFASDVQPGRILDIGCATGQTLKLLSNVPDLFESDFYGVEAARPLYEICEQRKSNGEFGTSNVFFYQRNIMRSSMFPRNSLNTIITMALTHEIESYLGRQSLIDFIKRVYDMLSPGGVYINYDVTGPADKDKQVYVNFQSNDGENPTDLFPEVAGDHELTEFLQTLSTKARFERFVHDFRNKEGDTMSVQDETVDGVEYKVMRWADLCDFLAKKDYTDSWLSEMHERFCFWNFDDWKTALEDVGFELATSSRSIQNEWLIENRFAPAADVFAKDDDGVLQQMDQPDTNVVLIAHKPA